MKRRRKANRGIVLLVVISLLVLFVLIAVTFAVVAGQYRQRAASNVRVQATGDHPRKDLDMVMYMLLRDTNMRSPLAQHSLLNDLYGEDSTGGLVVDALPMNNQYDVVLESGGQFVHLQFNPQGQFAQQSGYYNGCVLTFLGGPAMGFSTRIVGYIPPTYDNMGNLQAPGEFRYEATDSDGNTLPLPRAGDRFGVNGREFNGTGPGLDTSTANIDAVVPMNGVTSVGANNLLAALLPNYSAYINSPLTNSGVPVQVHVGGADESFDAATFHDFWLAYVPRPGEPNNSYDMILPSFHRPDLVAYWINVLANPNDPQALFNGLTPAEQILVFNYPFGLDGIPNNSDDSGPPWSTVNTNGGNLGIQAPCAFVARLKRHIVARPMIQDHPNFTGGNLNFSLTGPLTGATKIWDVDNDGDGVADSIWLDVGLPVKTSPEGRRYKPLFAILIADQDGKVNVNAADAQAHLNATYTNPVNGPLAGSPAANTVYLGRGLGVGPADLYMNPIFPSAGSASIITGRYGLDGFPGVNGIDTLSFLKSVGIPNDYNTGPQSYGSPPDMAGQGAIALDHFGQPLTGFMGMTGEMINHPYEFDPVHSVASDSRYTLGELERILRFYDADASSLPQRLLYTSPVDLGNPLVPRSRKAITTHSSHLPLPNVQLGTEVRTGSVPWAAFLTNATAPTLLDLYRARLMAGLGAAATPARINAELTKIVPFEILHGQPFDINRWLGNGLDDNGNGEVDEFNEELTGEFVWNGTPPAGFGNISFSYVNDAPAVIDPRQMYARQLYCLLRVVMDDAFQWQPQASDATIYSTPVQRQQFLYQRLAQWAINAVEFRDRDAIMTPFEYDINPFNGWICDGNPATNEGNDGVDNDGDGQIDEADEQDRRLVWGTEFPDLQLHETLAMHDRCVKDTAHDPTQQFRWNPGTMQFRDDDVDQYRKPQGSLFLELYCPRNFAANNAAFPLELYDGSGNLDLGRLAPARTFGMNNQPVRHPVWRAAICQPPTVDPAGQAATTPDIEFLALNFPESAVFEPGPLSGNGASIERIVWFTPHDPANLTTNDANNIFYCRSGALTANPNAVPANQQVGSNVVMPPNRHLVVGPRAVTAMGSARNGPDGDPNTEDLSPHQFLINGGLFALAGGFYSTAAFGYPVALPAMGATIPAPLGIVCAAKPPGPADARAWNNQAALIGLNVSEPMPQSNQYYYEPSYPNDVYAQLDQPFDPMTNRLYDAPFDGQQAPANFGTVLLNKIKTGTYLSHRTVYLQRLANPLLPWNPDPNDPDFPGYYTPTLAINPYITIDWANIDLTVFSGNQDNSQQTGTNAANATVTEWIDPLDINPYGSAPSEQFAGRERGQLSGMLPSDNFWSPFTTPPPVTSAQTPDPDNYFNIQLRTTLGYLNSTYGVPQTPIAGYEGSPFQSVGGNPNPFAWLTWNNRPYASPLELMLVPFSAPSRMGVEFSKWGNAAWNPYANDRESFTHLLNFFHTAAPGSPLGTAPHFYRIFDYLETPSQFVGTEKWYYPTTFASDPNAATFRPPYNRLSRFREPGRVNINTMSDEWAWQALSNAFVYPFVGALADTTAWDSIRRSRSGQIYNLPATAPGYPTLFANPFRSATSADLMPNVAGMRRSGTEATMLRSLPQSMATPIPNPAAPTASNVAEFALVNGAPYQHTDRNAYFRYRGINRLNNLCSTHSNVFAVWITVGYFEVEDNPGGADEAHPDGYRLGQEVGVDSGNIVRHRSFYIIDRSVPVAYERGQNHNVDRAVLLRRFIE